MPAFWKASPDNDYKEWGALWMRNIGIDINYMPKKWAEW